MSRVAQLERYADSWSTTHSSHDETRAARAFEATEHLYKLGFTSSPEPKRIFEFGSGIGGVTQALRQLFTGSELVTLDMHPEAECSYRANLLTLKLAEFQHLVQDHEYLIGLRTSSEVALHVLNVLPHFFKGILVFSLILESENPSDIYQVDLLASRQPQTSIAWLNNTRSFTEKGYRINYGRS